MTVRYLQQSDFSSKIFINGLVNNKYLLFKNGTYVNKRINHIGWRLKIERT